MLLATYISMIISFIITFLVYVSLCPLWHAHFIIVLLMLKLLLWPVWEDWVRQGISMFLENLGRWMDGKNFNWASNAARGRGISRWRALQKESTMGFMHLLQSTWVGALWVRPNPKRLNMLSQRMEVISVWTAVLCFNWKRNIHRWRQVSFLGRFKDRQPAYNNEEVNNKGRREILTHGSTEHPNAHSGLLSLNYYSTA